LSGYEISMELFLIPLMISLLLIFFMYFST